MLLILANSGRASVVPRGDGGGRKRAAPERALGRQPRGGRGERLAGRSTGPPSSSGAAGPGGGSTSRNLVLSVTSTFETLQNPAVHNTTYSGALEAFVGAAVLAYECGCSHAMLKEEMLRREASASGLGSSQQLRREAEEAEGASNEEEDFQGLTEVGLVWLVLSNTNTAKNKRWATTVAVSEGFQKRWQGFVKLITNAYFVQRMA